MLNWISTRSDAALADAAIALFRSNFSAEPAGVWAAPGRVNLIGEHVDYAGGASIPFALEQNTAVAVAPREDGQLRIASEFGGKVYRVDVFWRRLARVGPRAPRTPGRATSPAPCGRASRTASSPPARASTSRLSPTFR